MGGSSLCRGGFGFGGVVVRGGFWDLGGGQRWAVVGGGRWGGGRRQRQQQRRESVVVDCVRAVVLRKVAASAVLYLAQW